MSSYHRFAVFFTPKEGPLGDFSAAWLGWDSLHGRPVPHPDIAGLENRIGSLTATPRKYGFHATLKPPFHLAENQDRQALERAVEDLANGLRPVALEGMSVNALGRFVALVPIRQTAELTELATRVVVDLDEFRAPLTEGELARRRIHGLTRNQEKLLAAWGYPHVLDEFRFHMTLTGALDPADVEAVRKILEPEIDARVPNPFVVDALTLLGSDDEGRFHQIRRFPLLGT